MTNGVYLLNFVLQARNLILYPKSCCSFIVVEVQIQVEKEISKGPRRDIAKMEKGNHKKQKWYYKN